MPIVHLEAMGRCLMILNDARAIMPQAAQLLRPL